MTPLRQRMLEDMAIRNLADNTQSSYIQQIVSYAKHFHGRRAIDPNHLESALRVVPMGRN